MSEALGDVVEVEVIRNPSKEAVSATTTEAFGEELKIDIDRYLQRSVIPHGRELAVVPKQPSSSEKPNSAEPDPRPVLACMAIVPTPLNVAGAPMCAAQVGFVATRAACRNRGHIRRLYRAFCAACPPAEYPLQIIAGIPNFYRTLGFEYALDLPFPGTVPPTFPSDTAGRYALVRVTTPALAATYLAVRRRAWEPLVGVSRAFSTPADLLDATTDALGDIPVVDTDVAQDFYLITEAGAEGTSGTGEISEAAVVAQFLLQSSFDHLSVSELWVREDVDGDGIDEVVRVAVAQARRDCAGVRCWPSVQRPVQPHVAARTLALMQGAEPAFCWGRTYAWYARIPCYTAFLRRLQPVLTARLAGARARVAALRLPETYTLYVALPFVENVALTLADGGARVAGIDAVDEDVLGKVSGNTYNNVMVRFCNTGEPREDAHTFATLPPCAAVRLVLGHADIGELDRLYPDTVVLPVARTLLEVLFPRMSHIIDCAQ